MSLIGRELALNMRGDDVAELHRALNRADLSIPEDELSGAVFGEGTAWALQRFQERIGLEQSGALDLRTATALDEAVEARRLRTVRGDVRLSDGTVLAGARVTAWQERVDGAAQLAEASSDALGTYEISYRFDRGATVAGLVVRVHGSDGRELTASGALLDPRPEERIDLFVPEAPAAPSEYERLRRRLHDQLGDDGLRDLTPSRAGFVAAATGFEPAAVEALSEAERGAADTGLPVPLLYGLLRQFGGRGVTLLDQNPLTLRRAFDEGLREHLIPSELADQRDELLDDRLPEAQVKHLLASAGEGTMGSLGDVLATVIPEEDRRVAFARAALNTTPAGGDTLWRRLRDEGTFDDAELARLQDTFDLAAVTAGHLPALTELQRRAALDPALATARGFAAFDDADWLTVAEASGAPPDTSDADNRERVEAYARRMSRTFEATHQTAVIAARITQGWFPALVEQRQVLERFFADNPQFELGREDAGAFCAEGGGGDLSGIDDDDDRLALVRGLRRLERVLNVIPEASPAHGSPSATAATLLTEGLDSAHHIARTGRDEFTARLGPALDGGAAAAAAVHATAEDVAALSVALLANYSQAFNTLDLPVTPPIAGTAIPAPVPGSGVPDLRTLFGNLDFCACEQCRSVFSPSAYLVDALRFLADRPLPAGGSLKDVLLAAGRRPDLAQIQLSCENTNTRMPYVDLVCEILERAVSPPAVGAPTPQTTWAERELGAGPENLHGPAYDVLRTARHPWGLPFDLWLELSRAALELLGLRREELMVAMRPGARLTDHAAGHERLGLSPSQAELLTAGAAADPWASWGLDEQVVGLRDHRDGDLLSGDWDEVLRGRVSILLQQSDLTHLELLTALSTRYVNPAQISPLTTGAECDLTAMGTPWLTTAHLDRLHRFTRLWRSLGWSPLDTDRAIAAFGGQITPDLLLWLGHVEHLRRTLRVPVGTVLGWWGPLDTHEYVDVADADGSTTPSPYDRSYGDRTVVDPPAPALALNAARSELAAPWSAANPGRTIRSQLGPVGAGVGLDTGDVERLLVAGVPDRLTLAALSSLHAHSSLARALRLSVRDYVRLCDLTGTDPLSSGAKPAAAAATIAFAEELARIRSSGFTLAEVDAAVRHRIANGGGITLEVADATQTLTELRDGLRRIADETWAPRDPTGEHARRFLGRLGWDDAILATAMGEEILGRDPLTETRLAALPAGVTLGAQLSAGLRERVGFDDQRGVLWSLGALRPSERAELLALPPDPTSAAAKAYATAVKRLAASSRANVKQRRDFISTRMQSLRLPRFTAVLTLAAPLPALPAGLILPDDLPEELRGRLTFDLATATLISTGPLSGAEHAKLTALSADGDWRQAIDALRLTVEVAPALSGRFAYDPESRSLRLTGWLTPAEKQALDALSAAPGYRAAVSKLDAAAAAYTEPDTANRFLTSQDAIWLIHDARSTEERFGLVLERLLPRLRRLESVAFIAQNLSGPLALAPETVAGMLDGRLTSPGRPKVAALEALLDPVFAASASSVAVTPAAFPDQFTVLARMYKIAQILNRLGFDAAETAGLTSAADWAQLDALPVVPVTANQPGYAVWRRLVTLRDLRDTLPTGSDALIAVLTTVRAAGAPADAHEALRGTFGWDPTDIAFLAAPDRLNLPTAADFADPDNLWRLLACFNLLQQLGVSANVAATWAAPELQQADAEALQRAVRARIDPDTWLERAKSARDRVRNRQRDALVAYLVGRDGLRDATDLYGHFLLDVEMDACMSSSRIRQAIASVQLFVQRCLMNLEPGVAPNVIPSELWRWLKSYRVWEAARKVFLYAENWIDPELRDDKSPLFRDLEGELGQGDLTMDAAESAFARYLEGLENVARLEIAGMCRQGSGDGEILHVLGRTFNTPHAFFYRRLQDRAWTPWEPIDVDIEGDHLLPVIWNDELMLFWNRFSERALAPEPPPSTPANPNKRVDLQLAWTRYKGGRWQPTQLLTTPVVTVRPEYAPRKSFVVAPRFGADQLTIASGYPDPNGSVAGFQWKLLHLPRGGGRLLEDRRAPINLFPAALLPGIPWTGMESNSSVEGPVSGQHPLILLDAPSLPTGGYDRGAATPVEVLRRRPAGDPNPFRLVFPYGEETFRDRSPGIVGTFVMQDGLFFEDRRRTYFASYSEWFDALAFWVAFMNRGGVGPGAANFWRRSLLFSTHFHPYAAEFSRRLATGGTSTLLSLDTQRLADAGQVTLPDGTRVQVNAGAAFRNEYAPNSPVVFPYLMPSEIVEFHSGGAYSPYNWELFFHAPLLIATRLSRNQRFGEAQRWLHHVFDPTTTATGPEPGRYWNVRPFFEAGQDTPVQELARLLADKSNHSPERKEFADQVRRWRRDPFNPHAVARWRTGAYQRAVVLTYIDNLLAWGDQLFRRDTGESLNEATQLYLLADRILGRKPEPIRPRATPAVETYATLEPKLDDFSNALVAVESLVPKGGPSAGGESPSPPPPLTLYFCIPHNEQMLERWDRVADRLFKLRNCMNLDGVTRQLPLFDPPLNPGLLIQAAAAGVDLGAVLSDAGAPMSPYKFTILAQKSSELCGEVKTLGVQLLTALEHRDAEALSRLRSGQEVTVLETARQIREEQVEEARKAVEALTKGGEAAATRLAYYCGLLEALERVGIPGPEITTLGERLAAELVALVGGLGPGLQAAKATIELASVVSPRIADLAKLLDAALSPSAATGPEETVAVPINTREKRELAELALSHEKKLRALEYDAMASVLALIPDFTLGAQGISSPVVQAQLGGTLLSTRERLKGSEQSYEAEQHSYKASLNSIVAGYERRAQEWSHQAVLALKDTEQIAIEVLAAGTRLRIAQLELQNHEQQIRHAREADLLVREKYTNEQLYDWLSGQLSSVYLSAYQLAYDVAKRAERAFRFELGASEATFIKFGYWDSLHRGLLAGERLQQDIRRMEVAYLDQHSRGQEPAKNIQLSQLDPAALVRLRLTGACEFEVPEAVFDLDHSGHFRRRLRSVRISLPAVAGSSLGVHGTLTLLRSSTRVSPSLDGGYERAVDPQGAFIDDSRFEDDLSVRSIAFSTGIEDDGVAEGEADDGRYRPFEGRGAISRWRIELPRDFRAFNYDTITQVVLHLEYQARDGGSRLSAAAKTSLRENLNELMRTADGRTGFGRVFSLRHELPGWHVLSSPMGSRTVDLDLANRFPLLLLGRTITIDRVELIFRGNRPIGGASLAQLRQIRLNGSALQGLATVDGSETTARIQRSNVSWDPAAETWPLSFANATPAAIEAVDDVWLLVNYTAV